MKKALYIILILNIFCTANSTAQKVVRYPLFDISQTPEFKVDSVVFRTDETLFYFHYDNREGAVDWINISPETYIKDEKGKIYNILSLENIAKGPEQTQIRGKKDWNCILHFPRIDSKTKTLDFIEDESKTSFNIYGIDLSKDGEFPGYTDFVDFNRKFSHADFYFAAGNYERYIELATPLLSQARTAFGKDGVINILPNLIDSHVLLGKKDSNYDKYISEYRLLCEKHVWTKGLEKDLICSLDLNLKLLETSNKIYELTFDGKLEDACSLLSEYIPLAEMVYNSNDTIVAFHQASYAITLKQLGRINDAIEWGQKAIDNYASLNNTGGIYQTILSEMAFMCDDMKDTCRANKYFRRLYELEERIGNKYSFKHAQTGYNWGSMFEYKSKEGLIVLENAYKLYDSSKMPIDSLYIGITQALSICYIEQDNIPQSIKVWEHTMQNIKNRIGKDNVHYFNTIVGLAERCRVTGNTGKASEYIYELNKELNSQALTVHHLTGLSTFADILSDRGDKNRAIEVFEIANKIYKENNLTHELNYAYLLSSMATVYQNASDTINCINTCKALIDGAFDSHSDKVNANHLKLYAKGTLAQIYQNTDPEYSVRLCEEVIEFQDEKNIFIADPKEICLDLIKQLYVLHQDDPIVRKVYKRIIEDNYNDHANKAKDAMLGVMEFMKNAMSQPDIDDECIKQNLHLIDVEALKEIFEEFKKRLLDNIIFLTEEQRENYYNSAIKLCFDPMMMAVISDISKKEDLNGIIYDYLLLTKSILLASSRGLSDVIYNSNDKDIIELYDKVKKHFNEYSSEQIEEYEHEILKKSRYLSDFTKKLQINWKDVKEVLNNKEVALEFIVNNNGSARGYGVLALRNSWETPKYIDLSLVKDAIDMFGFARMANIWKILMKEECIYEGDKVFMSCAGVFQTKWFEHLEMEPGVCFSDLCHVVRVTSTREIVKQRTTTEPERKSVILFGGLDYDNKETVETTLPDEGVEIFRGEGDDRYRSGFERLIYSQKEIDAIQSIAKNNKIKCKEYQGRYGTEQAVRNLSGEEVGVLHFATHGLYYPENHPNVTNDSPYRQLFNNSNCLNRSFLVMSGGNALPQHKKVANSYTDGLLTAAEISHIDLHNVNLVVLSACQSAKGDISNEGVLGLQYGFKKAGVNSILMCLDNVDDHATQIFMEEFYKHLLKGLSKQESLKKAQQFMRTNTDEKYHSPEYWANYILLDSIE